MAKEPQKNTGELFRFDTVSVSIAAPPAIVWEFASDLNNWKRLSDFWEDLEQVNEEEWVAHTPQGDVRIQPQFDAERLLLDHICIIASGEEQFIPYRVVPNGTGSELMMTNQQTATVSNEDYAEQLTGMKQELETIKRIVEAENR